MTQPPTQAHWDAVYEHKGISEVSWYERRPEKSLQLIRSSGVRLDEPIIDVGGGASLLVDELLTAGYRDLTVLDISASVLEKVRERLGSSTAVTLLHQDATTLEPERQYALWHDRAVFHFLVQPEDRQRYVAALRRSVRTGGHVVVATFGPEGPERCSGLPVARYGAAALAAELGTGFELVESSLFEHRTPSNVRQQFLYCRLQKSAR